MTFESIHDVPAPAKLNLFLHVVGRRPDGYHLLQSVFVLIDWCDTLHFERRGDGRLSRIDLTAPLPADDLCLRAAQALQRASGCDHGAVISIDKQIPSGAGMGGGSSDAATTLLALNRLWQLDWPLSRLLPIGLELGADVPFFLQGHNAWVEGIGESLAPIDIPEQRFAVLKPPVAVLTKDIFSSPLLVRNTPTVIVAGFGAEARAGKERFGRNDLQAPAISVCPEVQEAAKLLESVFGPGNSRMTGSGSAVFSWIDAESTHDWPGALPEAWVGRICSSLQAHPLAGWARS